MYFGPQKRIIELDIKQAISAENSNLFVFFCDFEIASKDYGPYFKFRKSFVKIALRFTCSFFLLSLLPNKFRGISAESKSKRLRIRK